jgi:uncharacterized membrane protein
MENLIKKTMTAFLVLLTLMIPVSAAVTLDDSSSTKITVEEGSETMDVVFTYTLGNETDAEENVTVTFASDVMYYESTDIMANLSTLGTNNVEARLVLDTTVAPGRYNLTISTDSTTANNLLSIYTVEVIEATPDYYASGLVEDYEYENEVSPGDTLVLELELENDNNTYDDVVIEAYLVDSPINGKRVSEIQESNEFNLGVEEEETITMEFDIEEDLDEGTYYIYVVGTSQGRTLFEKTDEYNFDVEREENSLVVTDLRVSNTAAGETVDVAVTILNNGQTDEDNVLVSLSVAGQTVTSDYFTVEEDEELVRYFTLTLPSGASGNELVTVAVANEDVSVSSSTTVNVEARNQAASLTEEQVAALLEARLNQGNNNGFDDLSLGWLVAGLLVVYLLVSNRGLMPTTSRAASTSSRGRKSSKKYY